MDDGTEETEMTVVLTWQSNRESDGTRLTVQLEDAEGREWDPESTSLITGFLPTGWPRDGALTFTRTTKER
jgi:hypothetical protein